MGVLLSGHYGQSPEAESGRLSLQECAQRLGMKPSDFVSAGDPTFFEKTFGGKGRYLLFKAEPAEVQGSPVWKQGYYLLPLDAIDVLSAFPKKGGAVQTGHRVLPYKIESKETVPPEVLARAKKWADGCQPLFFKCKCEYLEVRLDAPWSFRRRWRVHLRCPDRCQPQRKEEV